MDLESRPTARRRRGAELEHALLDATWQELLEHGYAVLTIDSVARRAETSRPVIYRRWASKAELVRAALEYALQRDRMAAPDTGSLREDMKAVMQFANEKRLGVSVLFMSYLGTYFQETGTSPAELRASALGDRSLVMDVIIDRAIERGEIDGDRLTPRMRTVAFDLYRHEALMTLEPVPEDVIDGILDEVFLPLVRSRTG